MLTHAELKAIIQVEGISISAPTITKLRKLGNPGVNGNLFYGYLLTRHQTSSAKLHIEFFHAQNIS